MLQVQKTFFFQKVTVQNYQKIPSISNLQMPGCGSKRDMLELATLQYANFQPTKFVSSTKNVCDNPFSTFLHPVVKFGHNE